MLSSFAMPLYDWYIKRVYQSIVCVMKADIKKYREIEEKIQKVMKRENNYGSIQAYYENAAGNSLNFLKYHTKFIFTNRS